MQICSAPGSLYEQSGLRGPVWSYGTSFGIYVQAIPAEGPAKMVSGSAVHFCTGVWAIPQLLSFLCSISETCRCQEAERLPCRVNVNFRTGKTHQQRVRFFENAQEKPLVLHVLRKGRYREIWGNMLEAPSSDTWNCLLSGPRRTTSGERNSFQ